MPRTVFSQVAPSIDSLKSELQQANQEKAQLQKEVGSYDAELAQELCQANQEKHQLQRQLQGQVINPGMIYFFQYLPVP